MTVRRKEPQGCLGSLLRLLGIFLQRPEASISTFDDVDVSVINGPLPYRVRDDFLSPAEFSFYRVLRLALKDQAIILAKVNLADVFFVIRPNDNQTYRNKIDRKHVDFLLCDPASMKPLAGLELDDKSHSRTDRVDRDQFVNSVFEVAGLPLIRFPAQVAYDPKTLVAKLAPYLGMQPPVGGKTATMVGSETPVCPKCGVPMVQRVASKGPNAGKQFWGCTNYPRCREIA